MSEGQLNHELQQQTISEGILIIWWKELKLARYFSVADMFSARYGQKQLFRNCHHMSWWVITSMAQQYWKIILE